MPHQGPGLNRLLAPLELIAQFPGVPCASSDRRRWVGLEALRYRDQPPNEALQPPLTHHTLLLFMHAPKEFEVRSEGIRRVVPPPPGSILVVSWSPAWSHVSPSRCSNSTPRVLRSTRSTAWFSRKCGLRCWR
jgi:hypothetical protein